MKHNTTLVFEDGRFFDGFSFGAIGDTVGEIVFNTGMSGYQETLTDPSYAGQIVVQTSPHIGITGMNTTDEESRRIWVEGYIVRDPSRRSSNHRSERSLEDNLIEAGVVGISGVDTRAITRIIRESGAMRAGIFALDGRERSELVARVAESPEMSGLNLSDAVSTGETYVVPATTNSIGALAVLDLGVKRATLGHLAARGFDVHVLPETSTIDDLLAVEPVAVFYSNGPGDPSASDRHVKLLREVLDRRIPFFGICFGNQLLGRALGFDTYKLKYGHRGINQPVRDKQTGRIEITAHNHGFAVDAPTSGEIDSPAGYGRVEVSHVGLNDDCVEGLRALDVPAFSVQYHPEAAAGPHDSTYLFDRFRDLVVKGI
ncbi:MAG: glutamine-hydrolyzing carbamoyl-phosphate synthase small subunit [Actinobacteria bacterium]|uniref:carbamoyl-phosphate synthase (glutamine-hydrolyzing) n=1 Tax=freshwater metagenome TaxID=449393 RepID=A0A6J6FE04_9ZZZZ|nr:glutamine-hydrolyzing carbamoyl-phosphate synthase small subunit [Actinomycetota bacterium]